MFKSSITLLIEHQSLSMGGSSGRELLNNLRRDRLQKLSYETQNSCNSLLVRYFKRMKATCRGFSAQYMGLQLSIIPPGQRFCHRGTLLQIILPVRSNIFLSFRHYMATSCPKALILFLPFNTLSGIRFQNYNIIDIIILL